MPLSIHPDLASAIVRNVKASAIRVLSNEGVVLECPGDFEALTGYRADETRGRNYDFFFTGPDRPDGAATGRSRRPCAKDRPGPGPRDRPPKSGFAAVMRTGFCALRPSIRRRAATCRWIRPGPGLTAGRRSILFRTPAPDGRTGTVSCRSFATAGRLRLLRGTEEFSKGRAPG
jgi:PAS domain-containing protein